MIRRTLLVSVACLALAGCGAVPPDPSPTVSPSPTWATVAPDGGILLSSYGYAFAPADLSVPQGSVILENVDQTNTIVATFTYPTELELLEWFRSTLPDQGWVITDDGGNSLLFERGELRGAFTVGGGRSALAIRSDPQS